MKYILYFHYYIMSQQVYNVATVIAIQQDSLSFYVYDVGYVKWRIDEKVMESMSPKDNKPSMAIYLISLYDLKGIVEVHLRKAYVIILTDTKPFLIELKE